MVILIAEDEPGVRISLEQTLGTRHHVVACVDGASALEALKKKSFDLVITDVKMPGLTGLELLAQGRALSPSTDFILMTAQAAVGDAVRAIKMGAEDYLVKPFELAELEHRVERVAELRSWRTQAQVASEQSPSHRLIGASKNIARANEFITQVSESTAPVLVTGPSGTGKEVMARSIHESGPRSKGPFVAVNCASLSEALMESELFGHEKGAFTGAIGAKAGKFELASQGTLFLDEIGELSPSVQARLLRVLQEQQFYRVGGTREIRTDARLIAATHRNLKDMVKSGTFREDLYFRVSVLTFELEPLSRRPEDIPLLTHFFWEKLTRECGKHLELGKETLEALLAYSFPGNARELQNILERLVVLGGKKARVGLDLLPQELFQAPPALAAVPGEKGRGLTEEVEALERRLIEDALRRSKNNQVKAARLLKINRGALLYKLEKYGLKKDKEDSETDSDAA